MNYRVNATYWEPELEKRFGFANTIHFLTDANIVELIMEFGRVEITVDEAACLRDLYFDN